MINLGSQATPQFSLPFTQCIPAVCLHHCRNPTNQCLSTFKHFFCRVIRNPPSSVNMCLRSLLWYPVVLGTRHPASCSDGDTDLNGWRYWTATSFRIDEEHLAVSICNASCIYDMIYASIISMSKLDKIMQKHDNFTGSATARAIHSVHRQADQCLILKVFRKLNHSINHNINIY